MSNVVYFNDKICKNRYGAENNVVKGFTNYRMDCIKRIDGYCFEMTAITKEDIGVIHSKEYEIIGNIHDKQTES